MSSSSLFLSVSFVLLVLSLAGPMGGMGGGPMQGMGRGHGGPPFLQNATQEARQAFEKIFETQNQTKAQIKTAIDAWATTYGLTAEVTAFNTQMDTIKTEKRANVTSAVGELSNALTQVYAVFDNDNLTQSEVETQLKTLFDSFSEELKELVGAAIGGEKRGGMKGGKSAEERGMGNGERQNGGHH